MAKKRNLSRDKVIAKAAELANQNGRPDSITLTALAAALNIQVPSLYNHISGFNDLHQALGAYTGRRFLERIHQAIQGKIGRSALTAVARAYYEFSADNPGLYPFLVIAPHPDDAQGTAVSQEIVQVLLLLMASCGLEGDEALNAIRGLRALLHGFIDIEALGGYKLPLEHSSSYHFAVETYLNGLGLELG